MTFRWVSLNIFPWTRSNLNLEIKKRLNFNDFLWQPIFEIFQIWTKYAILEQIFPYIFFFETFPSNQPFICITITKPLSSKTGKTFCEGLKWMCKLFEKNGQRLQKPVIFWKSCKHFTIELVLGNSYRFCLASCLELGILSLFPLNYNGNKLSVKLLKSLCQDILLCKL